MPGLLRLPKFCASVSPPVGVDLSLESGVSWGFWLYLVGGPGPWSLGQRLRPQASPALFWMQREGPGGDTGRWPISSDRGPTTLQAAGWGAQVGLNLHCLS